VLPSPGGGCPTVAGLLLPMSFLAYNPPMLTVGPRVAAGSAAVTAHLRTPGLRAGAATGCWRRRGRGVNVFWPPFAQAFTGGGASATAQTDPTAWPGRRPTTPSPTCSRSCQPVKPQYLPFTPQLDQPWWLWLRYLLPVALFLAPVLARPARRRAAVTLLGLVLVFTLLGKGLQPPLSDLNSFLYAKVPGFWLFREPMSKLGQLLVLFRGCCWRS
jgi:arabinofuranan 3-O-arabinosyltransferase